MKLPIYLDHHATTPVDPRVLEKMLPYFLENYGNPSSQDHVFGAEASEAVEKARESVANVMGARPEEIIFTSGATESDNTAIMGMASSPRASGRHVITCVTEHKAVLDACHALEARGFRVTYLAVDKYGVLDATKLTEAVTKDTLLVSIMAANNEIGTLANINELSAIAAEAGVAFHTDAAQAFGHVPIDVAKSEVDLASISGHKVYGPKGVGALFSRRKRRIVRFEPLLRGGGQERGLRSGTLNVPGIVGLGEAARIAHLEMESEAERTRSLALQFLRSLEDDLGDVTLNGHPTMRLPHNLSITIAGVDSKALIQGVRATAAISAGSACTSTTVEPSHVLLGIGLSAIQARQTIRVGIGRFTTREQIEVAANAICDTARRIRWLTKSAVS